MSIEELEQKIICIIECEYKCKFLGKLKVKKKRGHISVEIGLRTMDMPLVLGGQLDDESFLKYIAQVMKQHRLDVTEYYKGYRVDLNARDCPIDPKCSCND